MSSSLVVVFVGSALLLTFFTFFIRRLLRRGHPSAPELMGRTWTFWGMLILFLIAMLTPLWVTYLFIAFACGFALWEYLLFPRGDGARSVEIPLGTTTLCLLLVPLNLIFHYLYWPVYSLSLVPLFLVLVLPTIFVLQNKPGQLMAGFGFVSCGVLFFVYAFSFAAGLLHFGRMVLVLCFLLTELRDLISYWVGKISAVQERKFPESAIWRSINYKIAPNVSPHKSWGVGLISFLLLAGLVFLCQPLLQNDSHLPISQVFMLGWAVVLGFFGLFGDLVFSLVKREFGLKDSGTWLPGNTGLIDRIDSLMLTIPATYFYFQIIFGGLS